MLPKEDFGRVKIARCMKLHLALPNEDFGRMNKR
jgi:hypothetical protein